MPESPTAAAPAVLSTVRRSNVISLIVVSPDLAGGSAE
jgi:hypothetical protein